ncbi:MAG: hypothetical protein ACM31N_00205 [Deltaproteobacteria bacterium]
MNREDYIVRIYRRDPGDRGMVVGTVEQVGEKLKMGFTDFEELRLIMGIPRGQTPRMEQLVEHTSIQPFDERRTE